jgi:hypothetical protein
MHKIPNGTNVIFQRLGKGQGFSHQSRHPLSERVVESLNVAGLPRLFADHTMPLAW